MLDKSFRSRRKQRRDHALVGVVCCLAGAGAPLVACNWLEDPAPRPSPLASLAAFDNASDVTLSAGEARPLAVQALDTNGAPLNGVAIVFVRSEPQVLELEGTDAAAASIEVTTAAQTTFGLAVEGVAQARIRVAPDVSADEADVYAFAAASAGAEGGPAGLLVRFHVRVVATEPTDAGATDVLDGGSDQ